MSAPNPFYRPFQAITNQIKTANNNAENAAKLAHTFGQYQTTGWGEFIAEDSIRFDAPYLYLPSVSYGSALATEKDAETVRATRCPWSNGTVHRWDIDSNGFYRGAWVLMTVQDRAPLMTATVVDPDPNYTIVHFFTFLGVAMKDLPSRIAGSEGSV